jgi:hypothetical protein
MNSLPTLLADTEALLTTPLHSSTWMRIHFLCLRLRTLTWLWGFPTAPPSAAVHLRRRRLVLMFHTSDGGYCVVKLPKLYAGPYPVLLFYAGICLQVWANPWKSNTRFDASSLRCQLEMQCSHVSINFASQPPKVCDKHAKLFLFSDFVIKIAVVGCSESSIRRCEDLAVRCFRPAHGLTAIQNASSVHLYCFRKCWTDIVLGDVVETEHSSRIEVTVLDPCFRCQPASDLLFIVRKMSFTSALRIFDWNTVIGSSARSRS